MARKFRILLVFISLSITLCLMSNTYSRYIAKADGNLDIIFARWKIKVNNTDITNGTEDSPQAVTLVPVITENANVAPGKVAPSSEGYFDIIIDPTQVDLSFSYDIDLTMDNTDIPDLLISKYEIISEDGNVAPQDVINNKITGLKNYAEGGFKSFTVRIWFKWYETERATMNDAADTQASQSASFGVNAKITFSQVLGQTATVTE